MKNSEIRRCLKTAYDRGPSTRKADFLRDYQPRQRNLRELLGVQFRYMGPQLTILYGYVLALLLGAVSHIAPGTVRLLAAALPVLALLALTGLGRSARYGMEELEAAARFSLGMLKVLRLAIAGLAGGAVMLSAGCVVKLVTGATVLYAAVLACVPYLTTTFLSMLLLRRWHSRKNIYGCGAIAAAVCLVTACGAEALARVSPAGLLTALGAALLFTGSEFYRYLKESEKLAWNLC